MTMKGEGRNEKTEGDEGSQGKLMDKQLKRGKEKKNEDRSIDRKKRKEGKNIKWRNMICNKLTMYI